MATNEFARWLETYREAADLSRAEVARQVASLTGRPKFGRDRISKLEKGVGPDPDRHVIQALADVLGRPVAEPLAALGYRIAAPPQARIHPALIAALDTVPWATQRRLADMMPALAALANQERS